MATIFCKVCNTENHSNSAKCEDCKSMLSNINHFEHDDKWENDYLYKEHAYPKRKILKLDNCEDIENEEMGVDTSNRQIAQAIKEEPEFQIEPDILVDIGEGEVDTEEHKHQYNERNKCTKTAGPKRNSNFSKSEEDYLVRLVLKNKNILENKKTDAVLTKLKDAAWKKLTEEYNASPRNTSRTTKALREKYKNIKSMIRRKKANYRSKLFLIGDGSPPKVSDEDDNPLLGVLADVITSGVDGLASKFDLDDEKNGFEETIGNNAGSDTMDFKHMKTAKSIENLSIDNNIRNDQVSDDDSYDQKRKMLNQNKSTPIEKKLRGNFQREMCYAKINALLETANIKTLNGENKITTSEDITFLKKKYIEQQMNQSRLEHQQKMQHLLEEHKVKMQILNLELKLKQLQSDK